MMLTRFQIRRHVFFVSIRTRPEGRVMPKRVLGWKTGILVSIRTRPEGRVMHLNN